MLLLVRFEVSALIHLDTSCLAACFPEPYAHTRSECFLGMECETIRQDPSMCSWAVTLNDALMPDPCRRANRIDVPSIQPPLYPALSWASRPRMTASVITPLARPASAVCASVKSPARARISEVPFRITIFLPLSQLLPFDHVIRLSVATYSELGPLESTPHQQTSVVMTYLKGIALMSTFQRRLPGLPASSILREAARRSSLPACG